MIVSSSGHALSGVSTQLTPSIVNSLADQPFVVGPRFSPVPAKRLLQIRSRKFVRTFSANLLSSETEPQLMLNGCLVLSAPPKNLVSILKNIGTQSVQELFFCDSIRRTVYSNDLVTFFWLRYTARKKLGIYDVHTMLHR